MHYLANEIPIMPNVSELPAIYCKHIGDRIVGECHLHTV